MSKFKCPKCEDVMTVSEDKHSCPSCETELTLDEATAKFEAGELVIIAEETKEVDLKINVSEHMEALLDGEDLSEEFQKKAATIFEAAVNAKIQELSESLKEKNEAVLAEARTEIQEDMEAKIDDYLDYVVTEWMKENELAIENGARTDITEGFIEGLHDLFSESFIDVPEERFDVVTDLAEKVEELEAKLDEKAEAEIEAKKKLDEAMSVMVFSQVSEGLAATEVEKLKELAEGVKFSDVESYQEKLETLKESYFKKEDETKETNLEEALIKETDESGSEDKKVPTVVVDDLVSAALKHSINQ